MVIKNLDNDDSFRVIHIDYINNNIYLVNLKGTVVMPKSEKINLYENLFDENIIIAIPDPFMKVTKEENISEIIKYDDITINYDEIIFKYDNNFEYLNMLKKLNEEKISLTSFKVQLKIDQIITDMELSGIFDNLKRDEITSIVTSIVENNSIDMDDRLLKQKAYKKAIALNDSKGNKNQQKNIIGNHEGLLCKRLI